MWFFIYILCNFLIIFFRISDVNEFYLENLMDWHCFDVCVDARPGHRPTLIPFWTWFEFVWSMLVDGIVDAEDDVAIVAVIVFGEVVSILTMVEATEAAPPRWWLCDTVDDDDDDDVDWFDWKCPKLFDVVISDTWHGSRFICTRGEEERKVMSHPK